MNEVSLNFLHVHTDLPELDLVDAPEVVELEDGASGTQPPDVLHLTEQVHVFAKSTAQLRGQSVASSSSVLPLTCIL